jgi:hypothetical protein
MQRLIVELLHFYTTTFGEKREKDAFYRTSRNIKRGTVRPGIMRRGELFGYSTVEDFARFLGLSILHPRARAM